MKSFANDSPENNKVITDIRFYYWTGLVLYGVNTLLNAVDFQQRYGLDPVGYAGLICAYLVNFFPIYQIRRLNNWGRNLFLAKFVVFALFFYPQTVILKGGSWMYSSHFPHGVLQRMSNFGDLAYEAFFAWYLLKRSVRYVFTHKGD